MPTLEPIFNRTEVDEQIAQAIELYAQLTGDALSYNPDGSYLALGEGSAVPIIALDCLVVVQTTKDNRGVRQIVVEVHTDESLTDALVKLAVTEHQITTWRAIHD